MYLATWADPIFLLLVFPRDDDLRLSLIAWRPRDRPRQNSLPRQYRVARSSRHDHRREHLSPVPIRRQSAHVPFWKPSQGKSGFNRGSPGPSGLSRQPARTGRARITTRGHHPDKDKDKQAHGPSLCTVQPAAAPHVWLWAHVPCKEALDWRAFVLEP